MRHKEYGKEGERMIDNTLAMRITREDKYYHSTKMTLKDIFRNCITSTNPLIDISEERGVSE